MDASLWRLQAGGGVTLAHLNACMWEFGCGASDAAVPARVAEELASLPPAALPTMVCIMSVVLSCAGHFPGSRLHRKACGGVRAVATKAAPCHSCAAADADADVDADLYQVAYRAGAGRLTLLLAYRSQRAYQVTLLTLVRMPGWRSVEVTGTDRISCHHQVGRTPLSIVNGVVRHLAGLPAALGHVAKVIYIHSRLLQYCWALRRLLPRNFRGAPPLCSGQARLMFPTHRRKRTWWQT